MITEQQLATWASIGASVTPASTYRSAQLALGVSATLNAMRPDVFLQGSYCNSTNVYGDSDVDVVVRHPDLWGYDVTRLSTADLATFNLSLSLSPYGPWEFRTDVRAALVSHYGQDAVSGGHKCLKVVPTSGRMALDVVPAISYRLYLSYWNYVEGIEFVDVTTGRRVVNYPKQHSSNGSAKNADNRTNGMYKHLVRIFKNARNALYDDGKLVRGTAPSYFVECLLYNVPDECFRKSTYQAAFVAVLLNLYNLPFETLSALVCQNGQMYLFGPTPEQWSAEKAQSLTNALINEYS